MTERDLEKNVERALVTVVLSTATLLTCLSYLMLR